MIYTSLSRTLFGCIKVAALWVNLVKYNLDPFLNYNLELQVGKS